ncbi:MAG: NTP transferase domain-containing protein [Candidatus Methanomethylicus sp.]|nr:NTP transferase domain-containing protein [Candidatus Methanomethylicus sp.]
MLAAGKGVRLEPLSLTRPKHLLPVAGAPLIVHTLKAIKSSGVDETLLVVHYRKDALSSYLGSGASIGMKISYAEQGGIFGTGHAITMAETFTDGEPFLLIYGDLAFDPKLIERALTAFNKRLSGTIVGVDLDDVSQYGAMELEGDRLRKLVEKPPSGGPGTINGGIYVLGPQIFKQIDKTPKSSRGEFELTTTINLAIDQGGDFRVVRSKPNEWVDVGRPWNLLEANKLLLDCKIVQSSVRGEVEDGAKLHGKVVVEEGASILSGAYIEGPVWISSGCRVGPNCYLRPYTYLGRNVKVGNSCEIKASIIMEDSHVGHLSYIGDSVIGSKCNLGAGTITANLRFDEEAIKMNIKEERVSSMRKKLGAFLGDEVKTGINVSLYPGIKIGPRSWVGPHTAVVKDVPAGMIATSRVELEIIPRR